MDLKPGDKPVLDGRVFVTYRELTECASSRRDSLLDQVD
jgi:hypothetical protein